MFDSWIFDEVCNFLKDKSGDLPSKEIEYQAFCALAEEIMYDRETCKDLKANYVRMSMQDRHKIYKYVLEKKEWKS